MDGHPDTIKMTVVPGLNWTTQDIESYLQDLNQTPSLKDRPLIEYYGSGDKLYIQINKWHEFQVFHGIRLAPSEIPAPPIVQGDQTDNTNLLTPNVQQVGVLEHHFVSPDTTPETITCLSKEKLREVKKDNTLSGNKKPDLIPFPEIITYLNEKAKTAYRTTSKATLAHIRARWNEGFRFDDFKRVVDVQVSLWLTDPKMVQYLRPETLFGSKFESYLNKPGAISKPKLELL